MVGATLVLLCFSERSEAETVSSSACELPAGLARKVANTYPDTGLVSLSDLDEYHRRLFREDNGQGCPGLVSVDLFGDGEPTWALVLLQRGPSKRTATLVVASALEQGWKLEELDVADASPVPVVWRDNPGKYVDFHGQKTLQAHHPVIVLCGYESWAIVYAWTGKTVEKIWISD